MFVLGDLCFFCQKCILGYIFVTVEFFGNPLHMSSDFIVRGMQMERVAKMKEY